MKTLGWTAAALAFTLSLAGSPAAFAGIVEDPNAIVLTNSPTGDDDPILGPVSLIVDDGGAENFIGDVGQFIWINRFTPAAGDFPLQIEEVRVVYGTTLVPVGGAIEIVFHEDTDGDNDPGTGSTYLASFNSTVMVADGATFNVYTLGTPVVFNGPGDVLVGVINRYGFEGNNDFPAALDQTATQGRSWAASYLAGNVPAMPTYPADEQWGTIDSFGFPGNWLVRAFGSRIVDADLTITKTGFFANGQIVFTITVSNAGPDDATNVVVTDALPAEVTYVSDDCGGMNLPPWTWNLGALANGAAAVCNITVDVNPGAPSPIVNVAMVSADQNDPNPGGETSTAAVTLGSTLEIPTLGRAGLVVLLALLAGVGLYVLRRRG